MGREKVIKGVEICYCPPAKCEDCPYHDLPDEQSCNDTLCLDALALLKEQEEQIKNRDESLEKAREEIKWLRGMLKEQEPVERTCRKGINGFSIIWTCGACGSDLHPNNAKAKYCNNCGQAVKWE